MVKCKDAFEVLLSKYKWVLIRKLSESSDCEDPAEGGAEAK